MEFFTNVEQISGISVHLCIILYIIKLFAPVRSFRCSAFFEIFEYHQRNFHCFHCTFDVVSIKQLKYFTYAISNRKLSCKSWKTASWIRESKLKIYGMQFEIHVIRL